MTTMSGAERVAMWNRNKARGATFSFECDSVGLWLVDDVTGARDRLIDGNARLLDLVFGDPRTVRERG